jgi:phosphonate transport system substrate-binding protein
MLSRRQNDNGYRKRLRQAWAVFGLVLLASGLCDAWRSDASAVTSSRPLLVGFAPFENQSEVLKKAKPIVASLAKALNMPVQPFVAADYPGVVEAMRGGKLDVAFYSPAALIMAERVAKARVILKSVYKGLPVYYSSIIVRRDSPIKTLAQLRRQTFAFVDPASTTGGIYPKLMLIKAGLDPDHDLGRIIYAGGHDAAILAVYNKRVVAAATFVNDAEARDNPWTHILGKNAGAIRSLAISAPIPNGAVAVSQSLDPALVSRIKRAFLSLGETETGRREMARMYLIERFVEASPKDYDPVREAFTRLGLKVK